MPPGSIMLGAGLGVSVWFKAAKLTKAIKCGVYIHFHYFPLTTHYFYAPISNYARFLHICCDKSQRQMLECTSAGWASNAAGWF